MVPSMRPTGLLLTFLLMAVGATSVEGALRKGCRTALNMPGFEPGPIMLVDGSTIPAPVSLAGLDPSIIHSILIMCWEPTTGEFRLWSNPTLGEVEPTVGVNVILVLTKQLAETTRGPLEELVRAQEAHFSQHSRYAQSLENLVDLGVPENTMLEFSATPAGWSAATPGGDVAYRCFFFSGDAVPEIAGMKEREVTCLPGEKASRGMREMYEGL